MKSISITLDAPTVTTLNPLLGGFLFAEDGAPIDTPLAPSLLLNGLHKTRAALRMAVADAVHPALAQIGGLLCRDLDTARRYYRAINQSNYAGVAGELLKLSESSWECMVSFWIEHPTATNAARVAAAEAIDHAIAFFSEDTASAEEGRRAWKMIECLAEAIARVDTEYLDGSGVATSDQLHAQSARQQLVVNDVLQSILCEL